MKNFVVSLIALVFLIGLLGGVYISTKQADTSTSTSIENSIDGEAEDMQNSSKDEGFVNGEKRLTDPADFELNRWYRFYIDKTNPASEAFIVISLVTGDGGFNGGYTEPGEDLELDLPLVKIGISTDYWDSGYIYWSDSLRLSVDAEVDGGEDYLDIYLDENVFTGLGDNETTPSIWFELNRRTPCIGIGAIGGGYVVMLENK